MNKEQARVLIKETFEKPFEKQRFTVFIKNLLNHCEDAPFSYKGQFIPDAYKPYISELERIGKFNDGEHAVDVLVVRLKKQTSLERARSMQRNFIAWYLNGSRGGEFKDAALVAFVSPDDADWRFSLVKMEYKYTETKTGKTKVKEEFTPARRWSFLVGASEKSHTAQSRLVDLLADDEHSPTLVELEEAFNIETVTKEFFIKYRELFIRTKEALDKIVREDARVRAEFEAKDVNTVDFAKKLLGQIVFLYFLQKKGWFGVGKNDPWGTGSKQFLRELFEGKHGTYNNFFDDIVEPLFYEALRIDRSHDDDYYSRFNCKIPFLNGGLFDPINDYDWVHTEITLPDSLFSNRNRTPEGDRGDGILDVFDRYNFTVKEDEPLEKEVAIDPELLGKAYEKFNAIRPDNFEEYKKALTSGKKGDESKFNKQFGVYYTPREIVHYMCQQSLIYYLYSELNSGVGGQERATKRQIGDISNSGVAKEDIETLIHLGEQVIANDMRVKANGKETATYSYKLPESIRKNARMIDQKLADITVCDPAVGSGAFLVGMMTEIVRIRTVLSKFINGKERSPYDLKRRCIEHSLYGVDIDPGAVEIAKLRLWLSLVVDEDDIKIIKPLPNLDYKIVCGNSLLGYPYTPRGLEKIEKLKELFIHQVNPNIKQKLRKKIDDAIYGLFKGTEKSLGYKVTMDFKVNFSEVFREKRGFDVVIANPPYVSHVTQKKEDKNLIAKCFRTFSGRADVYVVFYEQGIRILRDKGILTYITPNKFFRSGYGSKLRKFISETSQVIRMIDFGDTEIFDATTYPAIVILQKTTKMSYEFSFLKTNMIKEIRCSKNYSIFAKDALCSPIWSFNNSNLEKIWQKVRQDSVCLKDYIKNQFYRGIVTGLNEAFVIGEPQKKEILSRNPEAKEIILPYLRGKDVKRWRSVSKSYIIFTYHGINMAKYPSVIDYLSQFRIKLEKRATSKNHKWYELQQPQTGIHKKYRKIKIISTDIAKRCEFTIDDSGAYIDATIFCIPIDDLYLLGLLNSTLVETYFRSISSTIRGDFLRFKKIYLDILPLKVQHRYKKSIVKLVSSIRTITKSVDYPQNPIKKSKVHEYEMELDQLVYRLYGLTKDEIRIVEGEISS